MRYSLPLPNKGSVTIDSYFHTLILETWDDPSNPHCVSFHPFEKLHEIIDMKQLPPHVIAFLMANKLA